MLAYCVLPDWLDDAAELESAYGSTGQQRREEKVVSAANHPGGVGSAVDTFEKTVGAETGADDD